MKITFNDEQCNTWCLKSSQVAYAILEKKALEENLITRSSEIQTNKDQRVRVNKIFPTARVPTKGSDKAARHYLYTNEGIEIPAREQAVIGTGITIGLPRGTYGRIEP